MNKLIYTLLFTALISGNAFAATAPAKAPVPQHPQTTQKQTAPEHKTTPTSTHKSLYSVHAKHVPQKAAGKQTPKKTAAKSTVKEAQKRTGKEAEKQAQKPVPKKK